MVEYPKDYFLDEVRDGYFIPGMMKKAWAGCLEDYKKLEELCEKKGLHCSVVWGSLIAAIRHGGFIPWDDDVDVSMMHVDYLKLKEYIDRGEYVDGFELRDYVMDEDDNLVRKWLDSQTMMRDPEEWKYHFGFPFANNIDIFLLDYLPREGELRKEYDSIISIAAFLKKCASSIEERDEHDCDLPEDDEDRIEPEEFEERLAGLERILNIKFDRSGDTKLSVQILQALEEYCLEFKSAESDHVVMVPYYIRSSTKYDKRLYKDYIHVDYEYDSVSVPIGYDGILRTSWSFYMYPAREFQGHHYPFYDGFEQTMKDMFGIELAHFHYDYNRVVSSFNERITRVDPDEEKNSVCILLKEAHDYISRSCEDKNEVLQMKDLLMQCQSLALQIGSRWERRIPDSDKYVHLLEEYCEDVYELYERIGAKPEEEYDPDRMRSIVGRMSARIDQVSEYDLSMAKEKKEIVFVVYRADHWRSLHSLWEIAGADDNTIVTVIVAPFYFRDFEGNTLTDQMILETDGYPEGVELTDYQDYNFALNLPDVIITQCPYDDMSDSMTLHPDFYTENLMKYTENLVLIPPFTLFEVGENDERSRFTLRSFVETPGFIYADRIIAQSENIRNVFVELAERFVERETQDHPDWSGDPWLDWNSKITSEGSPLYDWQNREETVICEENRDDVLINCAYRRCIIVPSEWLKTFPDSNGVKKKILVYQLSGSALYSFGKELADKTVQVFKKFAEYRDEICVIWHMDKYAREILRRNDPAMWTAYRTLIQEFERLELGIIDDTWDHERIAWIADGYYGDGCMAMNECRKRGVPVLFENPECPVYPEGEKYVNKKWDAQIQVAYEGIENESHWSIDNLLQEVLAYDACPLREKCYERIWDTL